MRPAVVGQFGRRRVGDVTHDHVVAGFEAVQEERGDGCHAAGEADAVLGALEHRQLLLELPHRRVAPAGVDEGALVGEFVGGERDLGVDDERGGHHQVGGGGAGDRVGRMARVDGGGLHAYGAQALVVRSHGSSPPCCAAIEYTGRRRSAQPKWWQVVALGWPAECRRGGGRAGPRLYCLLPSLAFQYSSVRRKASS